MMFRQGFFYVVVLLSSALPTAHSLPVDNLQRTSQTLSKSPDGTLMLRRSQSEPGEKGNALKSLEIVSAEGRVLYQWTSAIGPSGCIWSPDSLFLAVNDSPGDEGDELRVFGITGDRGRELKVIPLREANGKKFRHEVEQRHAGFLSSLKSATIRAWTWHDGRLWCRVTGYSSPKRYPSIKVPFHDLWVMTFHSGCEPAIEEEWSRSLPAEKPIRSPE